MKNLITATASLNAPSMERYENQVATYLRMHHKNYVRYRVQPVFRSSELLARGIHMEAQSLGSNAIHFNVYIFNVQKGVTLDYKNGNSIVSKAALAPAKKPVAKAPVKKPTKKPVTKVPVKKNHQSSRRQKRQVENRLKKTSPQNNQRPFRQDNRLHR